MTTSNFTPTVDLELAALVNTTGAPPADPTQRVPPPKRRMSAARRNADMANLRDDILSAKAVNGDHMARSLMGWAS